MPWNPWNLGEQNLDIIFPPFSLPSLSKKTLSISAPLISNHLENSRRRCGLRRLRAYVNAIRDGCDQALTYRIPLEPVRNENFEDGTLRKTWEHTSISTFKPIPGAYSLRVSQPFKHSNSITSVRAHPHHLLMIPQLHRDSEFNLPVNT